MKKVVFGFLGTKLDAGTSDKRWERWRPTVALFAHESFTATQLELFVTKPEQMSLATFVAKDICTLRPDSQVNTHLLDVPDPWNFQQVYAALHDFAKNYEFREDCEYYVHLTTGTHVAQICLFLLLEARYFPARILETFSHGTDEANAWKGRVEVVDLNVAAYDQLALRFKAESLDSQGLLKGGIETKNASFNTLIGRIERVALASTAPILLSGPTGSGKSQLAKRIYEIRSRRHLVQGPLVEVNCATLRGDNAMSALFGHKKGAFTGAATDRMGLLKAADKGMLFLDEVAELGLDEQAMLLRALEDKKFRPLGSDKEFESDFQLLAGTNQNLAQRCSQGLFRADLLARINLWDFTLPGLKDRREDIEPNLAYETERVGRELGKHVTWHALARAQYLEFALKAPWPGNFRDLAASVTRMATLAEGSRISVSDVVAETQGMPTPVGSASDETCPFPLALKVLGPNKVLISDTFDLAQLEVVLQATKGSNSMAEAGRALFGASRAQKTSSNDSDRIRKYLAGWGLQYRDVQASLLG